MKMRRYILRLLAASALAASLSACATATRWPIVGEAAEAQCRWPARDASLRVIDGAAQWQALNMPGQAPVFATEPDWSRQTVIAFTLGARPTGGYAVLLPRKELDLQADTLTLEYTERRPAPGELVEQAFTQPCVFVLAARGPWRRVVVRDTTTGKTLEAALPSRP